MSYAAAKASFEVIVTKMQSELQAYAHSGNATQRAVDVRLDIINKMVEYYTAVEQMVAESDENTTNTHMRTARLHQNTQRLVYWCELHRVNPNGCFYYPENDLRDMVMNGRRFGRISDIEHRDDPWLTYFIDHNKRPPPEMLFKEDHILFNKQTDKYIATLFHATKNK